MCVCVSVYLHLLSVCVPEMPRTLTAVVTPSSAVLCPFCQESRCEKQSVCDSVCIICVCLCVCDKEGDTERGERDARKYLQDCVGGNSPLYPALCSSAGKPNNLRLTHKCISFIRSPVGKSR